MNQLKVSIISDIDEVVITPLNDGEETSYQEDDGIVRVPNVKTKNGGTVPVLVYDWQGGKVPKITRTVFYEKGPHFISSMDGKKYQINTKNLILDNIWMKNQKQKTKKIIIEGYKKPK
ncbi:MAG: hypothetical protein LR005_00575 [Candidatus Pacebacteria bacterium]|nr:hypothetical protein [Candidatus Paceibacterota bacterium]